MARLRNIIYLSTIFLAASSVSYARSDSPTAYADESKTYYVQTMDIEMPSYVLTYTTNEVAIYPEVKKTTSLNALASDTAYDLLSVTRYVPVVAEPEQSDYGSRGIIRNKGPTLT